VITPLCAAFASATAELAERRPLDDRRAGEVAEALQAMLEAVMFLSPRPHRFSSRCTATHAQFRLLTAPPPLFDAPGSPRINR
jgi:hypothetical protein